MQSSCLLGNTYSVPLRIKQTLDLNFHKRFNANLLRRKLYRDIATKLGIDDRMETTARKDAFITLKDHKPTFANKPTCRLINPTKSEIGKVSKKILDRINSTIAKKHNLHQWKNTAAVIDWFKSIKNKERFSFICFDIEAFYPSISQDLLIKALDFASDYDNITTDERTIIHAKSSILIHNHLPWQKKGNTTFDVTMGSYDGAETCELVGNFLLSQLQDLNINVGLYRDDGLAIPNATPRNTQNIKKEICHIFNNNGLRITIEANKQVINFLDVTFNLNRSTYQPFKTSKLEAFLKRGATMYITERNGGLSRITSARHTTKEDMKLTQNEGMLAVKGRRTVKYKLCYTR